MSKVEDVLESTEEGEVQLDLGNLTAYCISPFDVKKYKSKSKDYLNSVSRDNVQHLINGIFQCVTERNDDGVFARLPEPITPLPREKPIPKPKPPTKWELFAKEKGIKKRTRERMLWDDMSESWKPRYGYKRANDEKERNWVHEYKHNDDVFEDKFATHAEEKKKKMKKQKKQEHANIKRAQKATSSQKIPATLVPSISKPTREQDLSHINTALDTMQSSTTDPDVLGVSKSRKRRKFEPSVTKSFASERTKYRKVLDGIMADTKAKQAVNAQKGANLVQQFSEAQSRLQPQGAKERKSGGKSRSSQGAPKGHSKKKTWKGGKGGKRK